MAQSGFDEEARLGATIGTAASVTTDLLSLHHGTRAIAAASTGDRTPEPPITGWHFLTPRGRAAPGDTARVGYDPYRKHSITRLDYVLVAVASLVALGLVLWAVLA